VHGLGWGGSGSPAASHRAASPWAWGEDKEGLEPLALWGRQIPAELPFALAAPQGAGSRAAQP